MELTSTSDNVLTSLGNPCLDTGVGLGETLETLDKLGQVRRVLDLNSDLDDRGDGEPHDFHVVGGFRGGEGTALQQELIDTDETNDVSSRAIFDGFDVATHHQDGTLNGLDEEVVLLSREVVRALDANLGARAHGSGEDTTKGVEASLIGCGHHLGNVEDEGGLRVTITDTDGRLVVHGTLVEGLNTVALSSCGGRKVDDNHLKERVTRGQELAHDDLEEGLALEIELLGRKLDLKLLQDNRDSFLLEVHHGIEDTENGVEDECVERTLQRLSVGTNTVGGPLFGGRVEVVVTPELGHHLGLVDTKFLSVTGSELTESEAPTMETGSKGNCSLVRVDLDVTKSGIVICGDDDIDGFDCALEGLVEGLLVDLEFEEGTIDLVDDNDRLDALGESLTKDSFCLDANTFHAIDDDKGTISDTEGGGNF